MQGERGVVLFLLFVFSVSFPKPRPRRLFFDFNKVFWNFSAALPQSPLDTVLFKAYEIPGKHLLLLRVLERRVSELPQWKASGKTMEHY